MARKGLSVRETEALVRRILAHEQGELKPEPARTDPNIRRLETDLAERLGARVAVQHNANGRGKLVISYTSLEELDGILEHIK